MQLAQWIQGFGYAGVFAVLFVENLGVPFPIIFGLVAAAALAAGRPEGFAVAYAVLVTAQVAGATAGYTLGATGSRRIERRLDGSRRWRRTYWRIRELYERWGWLAVLGARFVGYIRPWASITAGLMRMRFPAFLISTSVGVAGWTIINWTLAYYGAWLFARAGWFRWVAFGILMAALAGIAVFWWCWGRYGNDGDHKRQNGLKHAR